MARYTATISHNSIARAHVIDAGDTLQAAKRAASREFGDGFLDHQIVIYDRQYREGSEAVATRRVGDRRWNTNA
jgi:hypothetical protein